MYSRMYMLSIPKFPFSYRLIVLDCSLLPASFCTGAFCCSITSELVNMLLHDLGSSSLYPSTKTSVRAFLMRHNIHLGMACISYASVQFPIAPVSMSVSSAFHIPNFLLSFQHAAAPVGIRASAYSRYIRCRVAI